MKTPWLDALSDELKNKKYSALEGECSTDYVVVGGGIAGASTLYELLTKTDKKIMLVEASSISGGATGHNAGQVSAILENDVNDLISLYGEENVRTSLSGMDNSWSHLEEILEKTGIKVPYYRFIGCGGYASIEHLLVELKNEYAKKKLGTHYGKFLIHPDVDLSRIPLEYHEMCTVIPEEELFDMLESKRADDFIAAMTEPMGVINSAHFTKELIAWCVLQAPNRVCVHEQSPVRVIDLSPQAQIIGDSYKIKATEVILCTNGFEHFSISHEGVNINARFHDDVRGVVGYMAAYEAETPYEPSAHWYYEKNTKFANTPLEDDPYNYVTRRPYNKGTHTKGLLIVGGPESHLISHRAYYDRDKIIDDEKVASLDAFVNEVAPESALVKRTYAWHGLMGYTKSGVRLVGKEPCASGLWYNLGCNGVGILPSLYGANRVARLISGEKMPKTIFDPHDQRCL